MTYKLIFQFFYKNHNEKNRDYAKKCVDNIVQM